MNVVTNDTGTGILTEAKFSSIDYAVFGSMLLLSAITGVYFGCRGRSRKADVQDYLMGNRNMRTFPVAMSLVGSYISGVTVLGTPAEIYNFGTQYLLITGAILGSGAIVALVYLPVFNDGSESLPVIIMGIIICISSIGVTIYLELRFDKSLRMMASIMFLLDEVMFLPVVVYVPALAFNQVTGINIHVIGSTVCIVCIFYTVLGGLRAVVWTDTWQVGVMFGSVSLIAIIGTIQAGGISVILEAAEAGDRFELWNWDTSLYHRHTVWSVLFGGCLYWTCFNSVNQTMVQRYMALPSYNKAVLAILIFSIGSAFVVSLCCYTGLLIYEKLGGCDPRTTGQLFADDQLLPAYVAIAASNLPGVLGIFVAGVFGAALSSMSVVLNSSATVVLEDIICGLAGRRPSEQCATLIARGTATILGLISLGGLFLVERLSGVLNVATSLSAIAASSTFGMFTLGMLWPWSTPRGTLIGAISGAIIGGWAALGSQAAVARGLMPPDKRTPSLSECSAIFNTTIAWPETHEILDPESIFPLYRISYHWIAPIGLATTLIVGVIASAITFEHGSLHNLDPDLFSPIVKGLLPHSTAKNAGQAKKRRWESNGGYSRGRTNDGDMSPSTTLTLLCAENSILPKVNDQSQSNR